METEHLAPILVLLGPTASGKTSLAVSMAWALSAELLSVDSRQVYKGLNLGTGKDLHLYLGPQGVLPHHLIDVLDPMEAFSVAHFQEMALNAILDIQSRNKTALLCGGTGLYLDALLNAYQFSRRPDFRQQDRNYTIPAKVFGLNPPLAQRRAACQQRLLERMEQGLIKEVQGLLDQGLSVERLRWMGLEYRWVCDHLEGRISKDRLVTGLATAIQQFAKRQMTYFRKMEREGLAIDWLPWDLRPEESLEYMLQAWEIYRLDLQKNK